MSKKKFLLVNLPTQIIDIPSYTYMYPPNGILSLYTYLKNKDLNWEICFKDFYALTKYDLLEYLKIYKPDILGFSVITPSYKFTLNLAKEIKEILPETKIILGGPHPTLFPQETLENDSVDYVVIGEGEKPLFQLLQNIDNPSYLSKILSLGYKENNKININDRSMDFIDLNTIGILDFSVIDIEKYIKYAEERSKYRALGLVVSRGCMLKCSFCVDGRHSSFKDSWRAIDPSILVQQIKYYIEKYKIEGIWFKDSTFTMNKKWILSFCQELEKENINIKWSCNTRVDTVDEEVLSNIKKAGCETIWFGVESGSERILKLLNKKIDKDKVITAFKLCEKYKIRAWANFMIGVPTETLEDIEQTYKFAIDLDKLSNVDNVHLTIYTPFPGTPLYEQFQEKDFIFTLPIEGLTYETACIDTGAIKKEVIQEIYNDFCNYFYKGRKEIINFNKYR